VGAGRPAVLEGAHHLSKARGGRGVLISGVPGVPPGNVVILGGGTVGVSAARMAVGLGADVSLLDINLDRLREIDEMFRGRVVTLASNAFNIEQALLRADLLVGAVLVAGVRAPRLVTRGMVERMKDGAVIVDVAVDQGGCIETIRPTTVFEPTYRVGGVVHYGVANMPALVPRTSTFALTNATLPYVLELARKGPAAVAREGSPLSRGINIWGGRIVHPAIAESVGEPVTPLASVAG
jgi:alanine dehydrogenase